MTRTKNIINWVLKILLAVLFTLASLGKLTNSPSVINMFQEWGYFEGFHIVIGVLELLGAVVLLIPRTVLYGVILLTIIMAGAFVTHLLNDPIIELIRPGIFTLLLLGVYISNRANKMSEKS